MPITYNSLRKTFETCFLPFSVFLLSFSIVSLRHKLKELDYYRFMEPCEMAGNIRLKILGNKEILGKSQY